MNQLQGFAEDLFPDISSATFDNSGTLVGITSSGLNKSITDNVNYAIKTKYLKLLIDEMTDKVELPKTTFPKTTLLTEKIKTLSNYVVWIKVK